jgi:hypothetical protein
MSKPDPDSDLRIDRRDEPSGGQQQRDRDLDTPRPGADDLEDAE